jgi:hypothetical protein
MIEILSIRGLLPIVIEYRNDDNNFQKVGAYLDVVKNEILFSLPPFVACTNPFSETVLHSADIEKAALDYLKDHKGSFVIPPIPKKAFKESFRKDVEDEKG